MKKTFRFFAYALLIIFFQSCENNDSTCTTCESESFVIAKTTILDQTYNLKRFTSSKNESVFMYAQNNSA